MNPFQMTKEAVMSELRTGENGLTEAQVQKNLRTYGKNELTEGKKKSPFMLLLE